MGRIREVPWMPDKGIAPDIAPEALPEGFLSRADNVIYTPYGIGPLWLLKDTGHNINVIKAALWYRGVEQHMIMLDGAQVYIWDFCSAPRAIGAFTCEFGKCSIEVFAGVPILAGGGAPQIITGSIGAETLSALPNWPAGATATGITAFGPYLVATGIQEGSVRYPHRVWWSHPASPASVPSSWDYADKTKDAGINELSDEESGDLVCAVPLRQDLMLYKERSIWRMSFVGHPYIFRFERVVDGAGAAHAECVAYSRNDESHYAMNINGAWLFDGTNAQMLGEGTFSDSLRADIVPGELPSSHVSLIRGGTHVVITVAQQNSSPQYVVDVRSAVATKGDGSNVRYVFDAPYADGGLDVAWDAINWTWGDPQMDVPWSPEGKFLTMVNWGGELMLLGRGTQRGDAVVGRTFSTVGMSETPSVSVRKMVRRVWVRGDGSVSANARLGMSERISDVQQWSDWKQFTLGHDRWVDMVASARHVHVEMKVPDASSNWRLNGLLVEVADRSRF